VLRDPRRRAAWAALLVAAGLPAPARADDESRTRAVPLAPAYVQECGACHVPYPPALLPAASWQRLMSGLPRHFGTDVSLDPTTTAALSAWLGANAGTAGKARRETAPPPEDRITRTSWFQREHREVAAEAWKRPAVESPSNCMACHPRADQGVFDEHAVRIPR
jgi:mono/diheme cytochrome c family protein